MKRYPLHEVLADDPDQPPKTLQKARRKFGPNYKKAYAWLYGEDALRKAEIETS